MTKIDDKSEGIWSKVRRFFDSALGPEPAAAEQAQEIGRPLDPVESQLGSLDALRRQAITSPQESKRPDEAEKSHDVAERKAQLKKELAELHLNLKTGLEWPDLEALSRSIKWHCHAFRIPRPDELHELAMLAVMAKLHREALNWGWNELERLLSEAQLAWPEPTGLTPRADAEQVQRHRELHAKELRQSFVSGSFARLADLIIGEVPAWGELTPEPRGAVWTESLYEAVAGALAYRRLREMESLMEREHEPIKALLAQSLSSALQSIQEELAQGVASITQARRLSDLAVTTSQEVAAEVVWTYLRERI